MKKRKIIVMVMVIAIILGLCPTNRISKVNAATKVINASDIVPLNTYDKDGNTTYVLSLKEDTILNMDDNLYIKSIKGNGYNLTIKGNKVLDFNRSDSDYGGILNVKNYMQEDGTTVSASWGTAAGVKDCESITLCKGARLFAKMLSASETINISGEFSALDTRESSTISAKNVVINDGKVKIEGFSKYGIYASESIKILGGTIEMYFNYNGTGSWSYVTQGLRKMLLSPSIVIGEKENVVWPKNYKIVNDSNNKTITGDVGSHTQILYICPKLNEEENNSSNNNSASDNSAKNTYSNEWINGKWYGADGKSTYAGTLSWKSNSTGWWVEDTAGWYPQNSWQKIDGKWYYFKPDGYMASSEYYGGYWFNGDGSWDETYYLTWKSNSTGWWVEDKSGWWPSNSWLKIDGYWYYFKADGYMATSQYVDGYWINASGVCE